MNGRAKDETMRAAAEGAKERETDRVRAGVDNARGTASGKAVERKIMQRAELQITRYWNGHPTLARYGKATGGGGGGIGRRGGGRREGRLCSFR